MPVHAHTTHAGLGLCPFAHPVRKREGALRCQISHAIDELALKREAEALLVQLQQGIEAQAEPASTLTTAPTSAETETPAPVESALLVVLAPWATDYRAFVHASWRLQEAVVELGLQVVLLVAMEVVLCWWW